MRYILDAALNQVLTSYESKGNRNGSGSRTPDASVAVPMGHPAVAASAGDAAGSMSCPAMGRAPEGKEESGVDAVRLSPQLFAAMDVDERTAIVHRYLPRALLDYVETALQVGGEGG